MDSKGRLDVDSLTLEQAKQELLRLEKFRDATYSFLHALCMYDIGQPLSSILFRQRVRKQMNVEFELDPIEFMDRAEQAGETIWKVVEIVNRTAEFESKQIDLLALYKPAKTDLHQALGACLKLAQEKIDYENKDRARMLKMKNVTLAAREPIVISINVPSDLPPIHVNEYIFGNVLEELTWLITGQPLMTKMEFSAWADEGGVNLTIGCWTLGGSDVSLLRDYRQFESSPTFLLFSVNSLFLFDSWKLIKAYKGQMKFDIEENPSGLDKTFITVALPRCDE
jgi:hypothetical protein